MKQFWTKTGLFFILFINRVIAVFVQKTRNSLIISPHPPLFICYFNRNNRKIAHKTDAGRMYCRIISISSYRCMGFAQNQLRAVKPCGWVAFRCTARAITIV